MATHHGKDGTVKVGANTVAEIDSWNVREQADVADDSAQGDEWKTHLVGIKSWSAQITCHWDKTDINGQQALAVGASVTLNLYPEGGAAGATYKTGLASITEVGIDVNKGNIVQRTFSATGNGALTESTV